MNGTNRIDIKINSKVRVVQKHHQRSGELTEGLAQRIITNSPNHAHGIKVKLISGVVGSVKVTL
jgi:uncharacterized repeat protein (TIGR03833 family)|tara:strand:- start:724 stop:915 length:192 start_codon:yes stop_codon:yes gene_type:complete